ncbi:MAG TPA: hypothetical protein PLX35_12215 [Cyclobacteriaceae bacterium]|nr:hypothetical protein [Cyclobacteriaceae bacterium]
MKTFRYSLFLIFAVAFALSCTDNSLDPLQFSSIKKGTILALRGTQLKNIYNLGIPGAEVFPKILKGNEKFTYDAEFLSSDPASLASLDIYVIKVTGSTRSRVLVMNVPASDFKKDATYKNPWVTISYTLETVLSKLGLPPSSDPVYKNANATNPLLSTYKNGIFFETDLNLINGTRISATDIVAAGLFQSDQFYPAMLLTWTMTDFCSYAANSWGGSWIGTEVFPTFSGDDDIKLIQDPVDPNKYTISNFWGVAGCAGKTLTATITFSPSSNPQTQIVSMPLQSDGLSPAGSISGSEGVYNQCNQTFSIKVKYVQKVDLPACGAPANTYEFRYDFHRP